MKQIGFILWDGETVRTGHDNAIKVYAKEEMARRISIAMGIPYRAVFIEECEPMAFDEKTARHAAVFSGANPVEPAKKPDVEWCLKQLKAAADALPQGDVGAIRVPTLLLIGVLDEMLRPS